MRDHAHDAGNLVGRRDAADFTFWADRRVEAVLLGLENGGLVQADG